MRESVPRLDALTGLRFVAAAAVVVGHSQGHFGLPDDLGSRFQLGGYGVTFFFVLSGFILAYVYPQLRTAAERGRFLLARFARVWPAHVVGVAAMVVAAGGLWPPPPGYSPWGVLAAHLSLLHSWLPVRGVLDAYNAPSWSISTEFGFYLLFIPLVHRWERTWWWKLPAAAALPLAVGLAAPALGLPGGDCGGGPSYETFLYYHPLARVYQFALGMAAATAWARGTRRWRLGTAAATVAELTSVAAAVAVVALGQPIAALTDRLPDVTGHPLRQLLWPCGGLAAVPFAALVAVFATGGGWVSRLLASRPLVLLGELSYGVYVLHFAILQYYLRHLDAFGVLPGWAAYPLFWAGLLFFSHWLWVGIETPVRRGISGLWPLPGAVPLINGRLAATWRWATDPRRRWRLVDTAVGVVLVTVLIWLASNSAFHRVRRHSPGFRAAPNQLDVQDVRFGDDYRLMSVAIDPADGGRRVRLVWQSLRAQPPRLHIAFQFTDAAGTPLVSIDHIPSRGEATIGALGQWEECVYLPEWAFRGAARVVLVMLNKAETDMLPTSGGCQDAFGRLILIPIAAN